MHGSPLHSFAARCPRGHRPAQSRTLGELQDPEVRFYCALCGRSWTPEREDHARALEFAEASQRWVESPLSAA